MVTERTINNITWIAESPAIYVLKGYPHIIARYVGWAWKVDGMHSPFENMGQVSDLVMDTHAYLSCQKPKPSA